MAKMIRRRADGTFAPGVSGNPSGRKPAKWARERQQEYLAALYECVSADDWAEVLQSVLADAKGGSLGAARFLAKWVLPSEVELNLLMAEQDVKIVVQWGDQGKEPGKVIDGEKE